MHVRLVPALHDQKSPELRLASNRSSVDRRCGSDRKATLNIARTSSFRNGIWKNPALRASLLRRRSSRVRTRLISSSKFVKDLQVREDVVGTERLASRAPVSCR